MTSYFYYIYSLTHTHTINWKTHHVFEQCTIYPPHVRIDENSNNGEKQRCTVCGSTAEMYTHRHNARCIVCELYWANRLSCVWHLIFDLIWFGLVDFSCGKFIYVEFHWIIHIIELRIKVIKYWHMLNDWLNNDEQQQQQNRNSCAMCMLFNQFTYLDWNVSHRNKNNYYLNTLCLAVCVLKMRVIMVTIIFLLKTTILHERQKRHKQI